MKTTIEIEIIELRAKFHFEVHVNDELVYYSPGAHSIGVCQTEAGCWLEDNGLKIMKSGLGSTDQKCANQ